MIMNKKGCNQIPSNLRSGARVVLGCVSFGEVLVVHQNFGSFRRSHGYGSKGLTKKNRKKILNVTTRLRERVEEASYITS